jgi:FAD/FMN-containing dehydrogenase
MLLTTSHSLTRALRRLRDAVDGRVIMPGDAAYDATRAVFGGYDRRPAAIVRVASATDVSRVVELARDTAVELAVRGGGHSMAGHGTTDGGVVVDLRDLKAMHIDVEGRSAWPDQATAFAHRRRKIMVNVAAMYGRPDEAAVHERWTSGLAAALHRGEPGAYVNFLGQEGAARVREAYPPPTWDRLVCIKRRYDPTNLFRLNQNIPPAGE